MSKELTSESEKLMTKSNADGYGSATYIISGDIDIALALGNLIYTLGGIRAVNLRKNDVNRDSMITTDTTGDIEKLLSKGKIDYYEAFPKMCAEDPRAYLVRPSDIKSLSHKYRKEISGYDFVEKQLDALTEIGKDEELFINNFDAVNNETEVVYAIAAMTTKKDPQQPSRISVVFRGSSNKSDWQQNLKGLFPIKLLIIFETNRHGIDEAFFVEDSDREDPIKIKANFDLLKKLEKHMGNDPILVHRGFFRYLFDTKDKKQSKSKYDQIVKKLGYLMKSHLFNAKSELTVTGHSLGAALATLLSFFLACNNKILDQLELDDKTRDYVSCISFAAPAVGNAGFQKAFRFIEHENKLRHVRITNQCDLVPLLPTLLSSHACRHTGVQLHLRGKYWPYGTQKEVLVRDTGKTSCFDVPFQFIGCLVTTLPCLIPSLPVILGGGVCFLFWPQWGKPSVFTVVVTVVFTGLLVVDFESIATFLSSGLRFGWNTWYSLQFNRYLWFWQLIMLARKPLHIPGIWSENGITHSLKYYKHNADEYRKEKGGIDITKSSSLWESKRK